MPEDNPYSAPEASLASAEDTLYQPRILAFSGRIGRMRYLAYGIGTMLLMMAVMVPLIGAMGVDPSASILGMIAVSVVYIAMIVISVMFAKRRLNDLNRSGWWFLLYLIPVVNLLLMIYLVFFPGTDGNNDFGPAPVSNSIGVIILAWVLPGIFLLGIGAAVLIPEFAGVQ